MQFKAYIDYFDEISHLERNQQFSLLEQAYNEATSGAFISPITLAAYLIPVIFILATAGLCYFVFGFSIWLPIASFFIGLLLSRILVMEINSRIMRAGLKTVLAKQQTS